MLAGRVAIPYRRSQAVGSSRHMRHRSPGDGKKEPGGGYRSAPVTAIGLWLFATILFMGQMAALKWLAVDYHFSQILFMRSVVVVAGTALLLLRGPGLATPFRTRRWRMHGLRFVCFFVALGCFIEAVRHISLADATAVSFASPLLMTALSVPLLGERVGPRRWAAVGIGLCGVLIIVNPSTGIFQAAALWALCSALGYALAIIVTRIVSRTEDTTSTVFLLNGIYVLTMPVFAPFEWVMPSGEALTLMVACGLTVMIAQLAAVRACALAPPQVLAPFDYTAMIWAIVFGYLIWDDLPDWTVAIGAAILVTSGLYVLWREAQVRSKGPRANAAKGLRSAARRDGKAS